MSSKSERPRSPSEWTLAERREASNFALAAAGPSYSTLSRLSFALVFYLFPLALGIATIVMLNSGAYPAPAVNRNVTNYVSRAIPFLLVLSLLEVVWAWYSGHSAFFRLNDSLSSLLAGTFERCFLALVRGALFSVPYSFINENWSLTGLRSEDLGWSHWVVAFVGVELCYYLLHRAGHEWNWLWSGHNVHHSSDEYNLFTALRQGAWFAFGSFFFALPLALILPLPLVHTHREINTLYQFWIHTRFIGKLPAPIEFIFNTPSHHRVHHGRNPQYIDKNYGGTLIIFDRIFGTFAEEKEAVEYGLTHMPNTWNPFMIQSHHWFEMWEAAKITPGFLRKFRVFLDLGPGYNYFLLHYDPSIKNIRPSLPPPKRLVSVPNTPMRAYVLVKFLVMAAQTLFFIEASRLAPRLELRHFALCASILAQQLSLGALFDQSKHAGLISLSANAFTVACALYYAGGVSSNVIWALTVFEVFASVWVSYWQR